MARLWRSQKPDETDRNGQKIKVSNASANTLSEADSVADDVYRS